MRTWKNVIYLSLALGMLIYAVPRLPIGEGWTIPSMFGIVWIGLSLLVVAAHLHRIIGVDEEREAELRQVRRVARQRRQQWLERQLGAGQGRK